jgi:site-specific recombinase XerD
MNLRPQGLRLSRAIPGFLQYKAAEALSPTTMRSYEHDLKLWLEHTGDVDVNQVSAQDVRAFLVWLRTDYKLRRLTGGDYPLSPKTLRNHWASREFELPNPMKGVPAPKCEEKPVEPFTKEEIEQVLKACDYCAEAHPENRRRFTMRRYTAHRDHAIILMPAGHRPARLGAMRPESGGCGDEDWQTGGETRRAGGR